jgi:hypothetical protein
MSITIHGDSDPITGVEESDSVRRIGTASTHDVELFAGNTKVATLDSATGELRADELGEQTADAGIKVNDPVLLKGGIAASAVVLALGAVLAEGLAVKVIEETVDFTGNAALFKAMTTPIPAGAVIVSVSANIEGALTGGGTTVKVGLGPNATDPDKYGLSSALTKNAKFGKIPDWAVLSAQEAIDICACATAGGAGNTALTVGSVRVRIVYLQARDLADAA